MPNDPTKPRGDEAGAVPSHRSSVPTSDDLREYLPPDDAATEVLLDEAMEPAKGHPPPALIEKLKQLDAAERAARAGKRASAVPRAATRPIEATAPESRRRSWPAWWIPAGVGAVFAPVILTIVLLRAGRGSEPQATPAADSAGTARTVTLGAALAATASAAPVGPPTAVASADAGGHPVAPRLGPRPRGSAGTAPPVTASATADPAPAVPPELLH